MNNDVDEGLCRGCGGADFIWSIAHGDAVCACCGCCDPQRIAVDHYRAPRRARDGTVAAAGAAPPPGDGAVVNVHDARLEAAANRRNSAPYRRTTYWSERISQWQQNEPEIPADDWRIIESKWRDLSNRYGLTPPADVKFPGGWEGSKFLGAPVTKDDCRTLLWAIDRDRRALGQRPQFVKRYLVSALLRLLCCLSCSSAVATSCRCVALYGMHRGVWRHSCA